jgi:hypothetical protein
VNPAALAVASEQVAAKEIDGEVVLIDFTSGNYYCLEGAGVAIWRAVEARLPLSALVDGFAAAGADTALVTADLERLAQQLVGEGLCVPAVVEAEHAAARPEPTGPYVTPKLVRYGDLAEHFAIDPPLPELDERR